MSTTSLAVLGQVTVKPEMRNQCFGRKPVRPNKIMIGCFLPVCLCCDQLRLFGSPLPCSDINRLVQPAKLCHVFRGRSLNVWWRVAFFDRTTKFGHVIEVGEQAIKVLLRERIILVVVTTGTAQR